MIRVTYHRKYHRLTIEGHAYSGEAGHDLVCASASILAYTLAANVDDLATKGSVLQPVIELREGFAQISCNPKNRFEAVTTLIFDTVCTGFEMLGLRHPENLLFHVRG